MSYFTQARCKEHPSQASPFIWERKEDSFKKKKTIHKVPHARKEKQEEKNTKDEEVSYYINLQKVKNNIESKRLYNIMIVISKK